MERKDRPELNVIPYKEASMKLSLREKVGQFFMPAAFINDTEEEINTLEGLIREGAVGGICFFHSRASAATNFEGKKKVIYNEQSYALLKKLIRRYQEAARYPLLIGIDAEWGLAMRIEQTPQYPYAMTLGAADDPFLVYEVAKRIGQDCMAAGIHWNFAPVADINSNPDNPVIGYRSFGSNREKVSMNAVAFSRGLQDSGILSCAKHFPGHGDTATDSHLDLPVLPKSFSDLMEEELTPFEALIRNGVDAVMVGHIAVPAMTEGEHISASVSEALIGELLRKKLGYSGVVVSDALNMHSVSKAYPERGLLEWKAFNAGTDVLCFAEHIQEGTNKIMELGSEERIELSFKRIWQLKEKGIRNTDTESLPLSQPHAFNKILARQGLTRYRGTEKEIQAFRKKRYFALSMGLDKGAVFQRELGMKRGNCYRAGKTDLSLLQKEIGDHTRILLSVFLPKAKPQGIFGLGADQLHIIKELVRKYEVIVYLFGNPYFLRHLPQEEFKAILIAYQDLLGFEEVAAEHFLGRFEATGKLPVTI